MEIIRQFVDDPNTYVAYGLGFGTCALYWLMAIVWKKP